MLIDEAVYRKKKYTVTTACIVQSDGPGYEISQYCFNCSWSYNNSINALNVGMVGKHYSYAPDRSSVDFGIQEREFEYQCYGVFYSSAKTKTSKHIKLPVNLRSKPEGIILYHTIFDELLSL